MGPPVSRETESAAAALLEFVSRDDYRPVSQRELLHRLNVSPEQRPRLRKLIRRLLEQGRLVKLSRGRLAAPPSRDTVRGKLYRHRDGYGFVAPEEGGEDVFIAPQHLGDALGGDRVLVRVTRRGRGARLEGVPLRTLERRAPRTLGLFLRSGRGGVVQAFDPSLTQRVEIPAAFAGDAADGQVVAIELLRRGNGGGVLEGKVLEVVGDLEQPGTDTLVVARKYGLELELPDEVAQAAERLPSRVGPAEKRRRERFDDPAAVTIDGETARDFDDAIAVEPRPNGGFRLYVHIADVGHFVQVDDALDNEARRRGTSVYFPDRVLPMLPEKLSNDLCSLRPGVDRLVQTAILEIDRDGHVRRSRFADGVIRSAARLTYTQVSRVLDGESRVEGVPARVVPMLQAAERLRELLGQRRRERGGIDFDLPEPRILLDVEGVVTGIRIEPRNRAHLLIEECMLAANEAVARYLEQRAWPCMFRVHQAPDPVKLEVLEEFVRALGHATPPQATRDGGRPLLQLLGRLEGRPEYRIVSQLALRSMQQARYSMRNDGHFGLAAETYCHFTSPIRRYPDLVVHRLLRACRAGRRVDGAQALESVAQSCSELERNAEAAERELLAWKKVAFIESRVGDSFDGVVTGVARFGLFVQLEENLVEGLVRVERLGNEYFEFDERRQELRGARSGTAFRLGQRLWVRVEQVDRVLQRIDLAPADDGAAGAGAWSRTGEHPTRRRRGGR